jgi:hypothetical protein
MTYGVMVTMPGPVETYDTLHRALLEQTGGKIEGMLLHIARSVPDGYQVIEVWDSKDLADRYNREVVWPLAARVWGDDPGTGEPAVEEFEVRGVVIPAASIAL